MEIEVKLKTGDRFFRVRDLLSSISRDGASREERQNLRQFIWEEVNSTADELVNEAFRLGREYERRNPS